jgi:hypothetical protein
MNTTEYYNATYKKIKTDFEFKQLNSMYGGQPYGGLYPIIDYQEDNSGRYYSCWAEFYQGINYLSIIRCNDVDCVGLSVLSWDEPTFNLDEKYNLTFIRNESYFECYIDGLENAYVDTTSSTWSGGQEGIGDFGADILINTTTYTYNKFTDTHINNYLVLESNLLTDSLGNIPTQNITEFYLNSIRTYSMNPYIINSTTSRDMSPTESINITSSYSLSLILNSIPGHGGGKYSCEGGTICLLLTEVSNGINNLFYYLTENYILLALAIIVPLLILSILFAILYLIKSAILKDRFNK